MKSFLWRVAKRLSYTEDARCLKVKVHGARGGMAYAFFTSAVDGGE